MLCDSRVLVCWSDLAKLRCCNRSLSIILTFISLSLAQYFSARIHTRLLIHSSSLLPFSLPIDLNSQVIACNMPSVAHLQPRFVEGSTSGGISATAIALIVCLGLIPVFILIWIVTWLMFFYGKDRTCCCTKRRKDKEEQEWLGKQSSTDTSAETLNEKPVYDLPPRPSHVHQRTDSEISTKTGRLAKSDVNRPSTKVSKVDTRMSMHSQASASTMQVAHEPKPFV